MYLCCAGTPGAACAEQDVDCCVESQAPPPGSDGQTPPSAPALFTAEKLLLHLHTLDHKKLDIPATRVLHAIDTAMRSPETFPQTTIASVSVTNRCHPSSSVHLYFTCLIVSARDAQARQPALDFACSPSPRWRHSSHCPPCSCAPSSWHWERHHGSEASSLACSDD